MTERWAIGGVVNSGGRDGDGYRLDTRTMLLPKHVRILHRHQEDHLLGWGHLFRAADQLLVDAWIQLDSDDERDCEILRDFAQYRGLSLAYFPAPEIRPPAVLGYRGVSEVSIVKNPLDPWAQILEKRRIK